ncbi:MAG: hypothetical protein R3309_03520 [Reinekea sp.]|nr:hypothetical protein [Reinekea sp.]MDX1473212.1 hypothetical protein [Reinekea sp.]
MKRLYYITDQIDYAEHISEELTKNGIDSHHIHVLSKNESGVVTHHLNGPNLFERVDFIRGALNGLVVGMLIGIVSLFIGRFFMDFGFSGIAQVAMLCLMMLFGSWVGGLVGFSRENAHIRRFHAQIEKGRHLMMIDVSAKEERLVHRIIEHLNEAQYGGEDEHVLV